jgi:predicted amidohydrolase
MYDLVLKGGRVVDPSQDLDTTADVAFAKGKVAAIGPDLKASAKGETRDVSGKLVVPGIIDLHTHIYHLGTSLGVDPVQTAKEGGSTTLIDAGSAGPGNYPGFLKHVIETCPVRILAYLNISFAGIPYFSKTTMVGECQDIRLLDLGECPPRTATPSSASRSGSGAAPAAPPGTSRSTWRSRSPTISASRSCAISTIRRRRGARCWTACGRATC